MVTPSEKWSMIIAASTRKLIKPLRHIRQTECADHLIVRCNDTDILIIMLNNVACLSNNILIDSVSSGKNTTWYTDVTILVFGDDLWVALSALSGGYSTVSFLRKGEHKRSQETFKALLDQSQQIWTKTCFTRLFCGMSNNNFMNDVRCALFWQATWRKPTSQKVETQVINTSLLIYLERNHARKVCVAYMEDCRQRKPIQLRP